MALITKKALAGTSWSLTFDPPIEEAILQQIQFPMNPPKDTNEFVINAAHPETKKTLWEGRVTYTSAISDLLR